MTERSIPQNWQEELKKIWGEHAYTKRMLFGPPLTINAIQHDPNPNNENTKPSDSHPNNNESSYFTPSQRLTSRILKRSSQPPK